MSSFFMQYVNNDKDIIGAGFKIGTAPIFSEALKMGAVPILNALLSI